MSDDYPPAPGEFGPGSIVAGYRLDEVIGRGGMAVVYRAFDGRLDRRVALKILAPELARDQSFRLRFIRESRAAAAVDHPNIIPIFEAGEAAGVLFIAMRFVRGHDVRTLIDSGGPLPTERACAIVAQVASALDMAHSRGLIHRDVKPGNMLRDATAYADRPDHIYLSDFGLSKRTIATSGLTSRGYFLGTLNYVSPEQIQGRPVDGRADLYSLACAAFEMISGEPPFKRDDNMAIMWAQVHAPPPPLTSLRPDLPPAVDDVMARALAKAADDRYGTCLEFTAALRSACGLHTREARPPEGGPVRGQTRKVSAQDLAGAGAASPPAPAATPPHPVPEHEPPASAVVSGPDPGSPVHISGPSGASPGQVAEPEYPAPGLVPAVDPTAPGRVPGPQEGEGTHPVRPQPSPPGWAPVHPPAGPPTPGRRGPGEPRPPGDRRPWPMRRSGAIIAAATVVALGVAGGYLLVGRGGHARPSLTGSSGGHGGTVALTPPPCTSRVAPASRLRHVPTHFVQVGGAPFDVVTTANGFGFVSTLSGISVLDTTGVVPKVRWNTSLSGTQGEALTADQRYLLVATGFNQLAVYSVRALEQGPAQPVGVLTGPAAGRGAKEVALSQDGKFAFVSLQNSNQVAVFNLHRALTAGFGASGLLVGAIPIHKDPVGIILSPDGKYLYVASGLANPASNSGSGTLTVINAMKAETSPASAVMAQINAGCGPDRIVTTNGGRDVWVTSGGGNALLAYSAAKLIKDSRHALIARVPLGSIPLGMAVIGNGSRMVVANSNRDHGNATSSLALIDLAKALAGQPGAVLGLINSGTTPRQFALESGGKTLLVTNTESGQVEAVDLSHLR